MSYDILVTPASGGSFVPAGVSATLAGRPELRRVTWDRFQSAAGLNVLLVADSATGAVDSLVLQIPLNCPPGDFDFAFELALLLGERLDAVLLDAQTGHELGPDSRDAVRAKAVEAATWASRLGSAASATTQRAPAAQLANAALDTPAQAPARHPWWRFWGR